jgi:hypothetical protein
MAFHFRTDARNRYVIAAALGVVVCAFAGYLVTPKAAGPGETKAEFIARTSRSQAVYR